ncbi:MAG: hydrogenase maturation nickel metallochaperone HypA [Armatimonadota bacterium]|nr:hydrogenase maturation nickel metallochaperone HypA [Armatimonadota bacterium]MCX7776806.1 hydrogenase maturation nickel metallochaperone HypA [Armatimonadota bacterium]MDW8024602.1 hydrogenase maturation nickel metallochaperone HypA [Armatimonadota bacterium]
MHEFSLAMQLVKVVERKANEMGAKSIIRIKVRVGLATTIVPEFLSEAFNVAKLGTLAEDAELEIEVEPIKLSCWNCGNEFEAEGLFSKCCLCGSVGGKVVSGGEVIVEQVELKVG